VADGGKWEREYVEERHLLGERCVEDGDAAWWLA
jgi:hypothetical protein